MATNDLITLAEAHAAINLADSVTTHDVEIAMFVTAVSQMLDARYGPVVIRTVTAEVHEDPGARVFLGQSPVVAVTEVKETYGATVTTLAAESFGVAGGDYLADPGTGSVRRRASNADRAFNAGHRVQVTYTAGRYASTATVAPLFKQAAQIAFAHLWRREQGLGSATFGEAVEEPATIPTFALPNAVAELLAHERRAPGVA